VVAQALLRAQVVEAGNGEDGKEQEGLGDAQLCAFDVWRDDDEGNVSARSTETISSSTTSPSAAAMVGEPGAAVVVAVASSGRGCWMVGPALCRRSRSWTCCSRAWMRLACASVGRAARGG
jgi:hypothetical protein